MVTCNNQKNLQEKSLEIIAWKTNCTVPLLEFKAEHFNIGVKP